MKKKGLKIPKYLVKKLFENQEKIIIIFENNISFFDGQNLTLKKCFAPQFQAKVSTYVSQEEQTFAVLISDGTALVKKKK